VGGVPGRSPGHFQVNSQWTGRGGMLHVSHGRRRYHQPHAVRLCSRFVEAGGIVEAPHDGVPGRFPRAFSCLLSMGWQDLACSRVSRVATAPSVARYVTLWRLGFFTPKLSSRTPLRSASIIQSLRSVARLQLVFTFSGFATALLGWAC